MSKEAFIIRRPYPGENNNISRVLNSAQPYGKPLGAHASVSGEADVAGGTNFLGFLGRQVTSTGPVLADHVYPGRLELPWKTGDTVTIEPPADEVEFNDTFAVSSGTGALSGSTTVGTLLSFNSGKFYVKQSSDQAYYSVSEVLTAESDENFRLRAVRV